MPQCRNDMQCQAYWDKGNIMPTLSRFLTTAFLTLTVAMASAPIAFAQASGKPLFKGMLPDIDTKDFGVVAGAGAYVSPNYTGDDNYRVRALPFIRASYGDNFWASVPEGLNYRIYDKDGLTVTAKAEVAFARDEDGESFFAVTGEGTDDLLGLGNIGTSVELGAAVSYGTGPVSFGGSLRQGVGGHGALIGDASVSYRHIFKAGDTPIAVFLTPNIKFGAADLTQTYYGITPEQSRASGLEAFETDGGIYSVGLNTLAFIPTSEKSAFMLYGSVRELTGDAADSPLIRQRGESTQFFGGLFWVRAFGQDARRARELVGGRR